MEPCDGLIPHAGCIPALRLVFLFQKSDAYPASQTQILILSTRVMHALKTKSFTVFRCAQFPDTHPEKGDPYGVSMHAV